MSKSYDSNILDIDGSLWNLVGILGSLIFRIKSTQVAPPSSERKIRANVCWNVWNSLSWEILRLILPEYNKCVSCMEVSYYIKWVALTYFLKVTEGIEIRKWFSQRDDHYFFTCKHISIYYYRIIIQSKIYHMCRPDGATGGIEWN